MILWFLEQDLLLSTTQMRMRIMLKLMRIINPQWWLEMPLWCFTKRQGCKYPLPLELSMNRPHVVSTFGSMVNVFLWMGERVQRETQFDAQGLRCLFLLSLWHLYFPTCSQLYKTPSCWNTVKCKILQKVNVQWNKNSLCDCMIVCLCFLFSAHPNEYMGGVCVFMGKHTPSPMIDIFIWDDV